MQNLSFVIWLVLYPVAVALVRYLEFLVKGSVVSELSLTAMFSFLTLVIWVAVGYLLYVPQLRNALQAQVAKSS